MKNVDLKSALLGLLAGVVITFATGAGQQANQVGRFQISGTANQGLVVDTVTGEVWSSYFSSGGGRADTDFQKPKLGTTR